MKLFVKIPWVTSKTDNIKDSTKHNNDIIPKSLLGTDLMKPKKVRKNHSGIIFSEVFIGLHDMKDSSWKTKYQKIITK